MARVREKKIKRKVTTARSQRLPHGPRGGIELLLIQSIDRLGEQGDVVEVKPGHAKNYLLPQGLATLATDHHKRMVDKHRAHLKSIEEQRLVGLRTIADNLAAQSLTIEANANDDGHLYGSVGPAEIVSALKRIEFSITEDQVRLEGPLKELGLYTVKIHLAREIETGLKVWIVPMVDEDAPAEDAS